MWKRARKRREPVRPLEEKMADPDETPAICMAMRLHLAIVCARLCTNPECRRRGMCSSPALDCKLRPLADAYDWDYEWFNSQRKPMYGVPEDSWMPPIMGETPEFRAQQARQLMEDRASLRTKLNPDPDAE